MKNFLRKLGLPIPPDFRITSKETLEEAAVTFGLLPFFPCAIRGLSVEEMCAPGLLFGGNYEEGCWEWKGPVIRKKTTSYGKFFHRKAGFVALDLLPDFLNIRRAKYPVKPGSMDEMLLDIIRENDSLTSTELKQLIFGGRKRRSWDELPDVETNLPATKSKSLESPLQRLQMGGWIIISDFEYKRTKHGERYGWGVARYSTPEFNFSSSFEETKGLPFEESFSRILKRVQESYPFIKSNDLKKLLL